MSKICTNCGASVADEAAFCPTCGAGMNNPAEAPSQPPQGNGYYQQPPQGNGYYQQPQGNMYAQQNYPPNNQAAPGPNPVISFANKCINDAKAFANKLGKEKLIKYSIIGASALVALIVAIVVVVNLLFPSPEAVLKKGLNAAINGNAEQLVSVLPPFLLETDDMDKEDFIEELEEEFEDSEYEDIEYKIKSIKKVSSSEKKSLKSALKLYEDLTDNFDADQVTDFMVAEVRIDDGGDKSTVDIPLIKYKGRWYLWMTSLW